MYRKILIIVLDKINNLSKDLATINKSHIFCNIDDKITYDSIRNGVYKYVDKLFITSDEEIVHKLLYDFPKYRIVYIESTKQSGIKRIKFPMNVESYQNVNEPIFRYISEGIKYLSIKEIEFYTTKNITVNATKIDLEVVLAGKMDMNVSMGNIKKIIDSITHNQILSEKYVLDTIDVMYCGENKELIKNMFSLNEVVDFIDEHNHHHDMLQHIKYTNLYDLVDRTKYLYFWRGLYGALSCIRSKLKTVTSKNRRFIMIIDIAQLDQKCTQISVSDQILEMMEYVDREIIYMHNDVMALGTTKIMSYYMTLYKYYGSYRFKEHTRDVVDCGILTKEQYFETSPKMGLKSELQLFEHIYRFTDLVMTRVQPFVLNQSMPEIIKRKSTILITYYGIYEQFTYVESIMRKLGYDVYDFPFNKTINEKGADGCVASMCQMIDDHNPSICLWWTLNIDPSDFYKIVSKNKTVKHIYFNWDEPYNWKPCNLSSKAKYLDISLITCSETTERYINSGTKHSYCVYPGYCPELHKPYWLSGEPIQYLYDISFICTNLYQDKTQYPDQIVDRKKLVDTIYNNQKVYGYTFAIFGPEQFKEMYPDSYKGFIKYNDTSDMMNRSRINLCTHVVGNKKGYLNERVFLILGSGGLLLIDPLPGVEDILVNGENCLMIDQTRILRQIKLILSNYEYYHKVKQNAYKTASSYTWDEWGMRVEEKIKMHYS